MSKKRGFTLIELMVVILIVSILAAVAIPIMRGRIDAAKWSEGKAMAGTLATSLRAYYAEKGDLGVDNPALDVLGFSAGDFTGTYFDETDYGWLSTWNVTTGTPTFMITVNAPETSWTPQTVTLSHLGAWTP